MSVAKLLKTNPILSDRLRLSIMGILASSDEEVSFNEILEALDVTKGNLSSHIKKLEDEGFVIVNKIFVNRKPRTLYGCSKEGRQALQEYLESVRVLLSETK